MTNNSVNKYFLIIIWNWFFSELQKTGQAFYEASLMIWKHFQFDMNKNT